MLSILHKYDQGLELDRAIKTNAWPRGKHSLASFVASDFEVILNYIPIYKKVKWTFYGIPCMSITTRKKDITVIVFHNLFEKKCHWCDKLCKPIYVSFASPTSASICVFVIFATGTRESGDVRRTYFFLWPVPASDRRLRKYP